MAVCDAIDSCFGLASFVEAGSVFKDGVVDILAWLCVKAWGVATGVGDAWKVAFSCGVDFPTVDGTNGFDKGFSPIPGVGNFVDAVAINNPLVPAFGTAALLVSTSMLEVLEGPDIARDGVGSFVVVLDTSLAVGEVSDFTFANAFTDDVVGRSLLAISAVVVGTCADGSDFTGPPLVPVPVDVGTDSLVGV